MDIGDRKWYQCVNMHKNRHRCIIIIADKDECLKAFPNIFTYSTSISESSRNSQISDSSHLGKVILMIDILTTSINDIQYDELWDNTIYKKVKSCKPNVLKS